MGVANGVIAAGFEELMKKTSAFLSLATVLLTLVEGVWWLTKDDASPELRLGVSRIERSKNLPKLLVPQSTEPTVPVVSRICSPPEGLSTLARPAAGT